MKKLLLSLMTATFCLVAVNAQNVLNNTGNINVDGGSGGSAVTGSVGGYPVTGASGNIGGNGYILWLGDQ